ncbi:MAG: hypothetical protein DCC67_14340 [Planctomycetota bacterium]|nr:MAG: hypothetical protein DCC67_14340 [Planctomycetota bacterium]
MSLRTRIASLLVGLSLVLVATMYAVLKLVVLPTFTSLEQDLESLSNMACDWAAWDDTYEYLADRNERYAAVNLVSDTFINAHLNLICLLDCNRRVVWGEVHRDETGDLEPVPDLFAAVQDQSCPLSHHDSADDSQEGVVVTSCGHMLVASRPIVTTKRQGPIRGALLMGRFLHADEIRDLASRTHVRLQSWTIGQEALPPEAQRVVDRRGPPNKAYIETVDAQTLHAYRTVYDVYGKPALLLRVAVPREVTAHGAVAARVATACSFLGGGLTLAATWLALHRAVVKPLGRMAAHAVKVGRSGDLRTRLNFRRNDEIGALADQFDSMVEHLAQYRQKLQESAHRSGMEEVASEVLHNVGNAVNSAICSTEALRESLAASKAAGLGRAAALLREQGPHAAAFFAADPRGPKLIDYLIALDDSLQAELAEQRAEADRLLAVVCHIRDVVAAQQAYTGQAEYRQETSLAALVDESLMLNREALSAHGVAVSVDLPELPDLLLSKTKVTQVLVNLVRNAIEAMQEQPMAERKLAISAHLTADQGIEIEVTDTGHGFTEEVREKLFMHGFTTKPTGRGLGLHYCANAVLGSGGAISGDSPGPCRGATFRIRLAQVVPEPIPAA